MPDRDRQLISLEADAIFGVVPSADGSAHILLDQEKKAAFAWSPNGRVLALNPDSGITFSESDSGGAQDYLPGEMPDTVRELAAALRDANPSEPVTIEGGPSWIIPETPSHTTPLPNGVEIIVSDPAGQDVARQLHRPNNWEPHEWPDLVEGRLGNWAMAVRNNEPVAICFTPAANSRVAEAGVWTRPDHRGHRLASAVTWAWASRERSSGRTLLYLSLILAGVKALCRNHLCRRRLMPGRRWLWLVDSARRSPFRSKLRYQFTAPVNPQRVNSLTP